MRATKRAWLDTDLEYGIDNPATDGPETPTENTHVRTIQLLDRDDIRDLAIRMPT
jgi:hypothetical protein